MSFLKGSTRNLTALMESLASEWTFYPHAKEAYEARDMEVFKKRLEENDESWYWFRMVICVETDWQFQWAFECVRTGKPCVDVSWRLIDTGEESSLFDMLTWLEATPMMTKALRRR